MDAWLLYILENKMLIKVSDFGEVLISRPSGREAFLQAQAYLFPKDGSIDKLIFDFDGVKVLAPSWADEFSPLPKTNTMFLLNALTQKIQA